MCSACGSSWLYPRVDAALFQVDLAGRACPVCEACTLSIAEGPVPPIAATLRSPQKAREKTAAADIESTTGDARQVG